MSVLVFEHSCSTHRPYRMTCEDYCAALDRARYACERCGRTDRPLQVDHDHALGLAAVRGMLCLPCNLHLGHVGRGDREPSERDRAYLEAASHRTRDVAHVVDRRTKHRAVRVDDALWQAAQERAADRRESVADVIRRALLAYVEQT